MSRPRFIALLLALATLAVFLPAGRLGFVSFDDNDYVTENPFVKNGLTVTGICWAFTTSHAGNWHPLTWLSHMADCELFQLNPGAHHYDNVLIHAANVVLLFALLLRLTQKPLPAAFIAALFAWHPLHVESVAWVSERKDVLSTFFALLSLLSYIKYVQEKSRRSLWLAFLFFTLGLMAKPMLVTLPFVMLLLDWWPLNRLAGARPSSASGLILEKTPFFALTVISCIVTFIVQKQGEAVISLARVPLLLRLENAPVAAVDYLLKFFWPENLCAFYPMPEKIPALPVLLSVAALLVISAAVWRWRDQKPYLLFGWLWFLGTLVPVIGLLQVGGQAMADRYTYIPSIGFFLALVLLARDLAVWLQMPKIIRCGLMALAAAACILVTEHQLQFWRDGESLFRRVLAVTPTNDVALINLGVALQSQDRFEEALAIYRQAERISSTRYQLHNNIGDILGHMGRHAEALAEYQQAIALRPGNALLHLSAGIELAALDRLAEALSEFSRAEKCDTTLAGPHIEAAKALFKQGRDATGVEEFRAALRLDADNYQTLAVTARYLAASENDATRDGKNALLLALKADELSGHNQPVVFDILGMAFAANGDYTNAAACARNALDLAAAAQLTNTEQIRSRLELYRNNLPWRECFRATNAPAKN